MFFSRATALALLRQIGEQIRPGGLAIVNTLIEGTSYLGMFKPDEYYLFGPDELELAFAGWTMLEAARYLPGAGGHTQGIFDRDRPENWT